MATACGRGATEPEPGLHAAQAAKKRRSASATQLLVEAEGLARKNREFLAERRIAMVNLIGSPGAGKTALLEATIRELGAELPLGVLEGDQATELDAARIARAGAPAVQITTGADCHLDSAMVADALGALDPRPGSLLFVENVGNLVCPARFDLGERAKVVVMSVTEGEDKPLKYPQVFRAASLLVLSKLDLMQHLTFDLERCVDYARSANPRLQVICLSTRAGTGLTAWYGWLRRQHAHDLRAVSQ